MGRSTATDLILSAEMRNLPEVQRKVIAFSDNRQDTALQAAHIHSLVLEVLGMGIDPPFSGQPFRGLKMPSSPQEIMKIDHETYPMYPDLRSAWEDVINKYSMDI